MSEFVPGVHVLQRTIFSRIYLIEDESMTLVDTGMPWDAQRVLRYMRSIGRRPEDLGTILITHGHPDHVSGALSLKRRTGAEIVAHSGDTRALPGGQATLSYMGVFSSLGVPVPFLQRTIVDRLAADGEVLAILGGVRVLHTPGHTPGSTCYLVEDRGLLFSGDTLFSDGERVSRSIPFPGYDGVAYRRSLERLASLGFDALCGGHGMPLVAGASERLRELLAARPDPPSWRDYMTSLPGRLYRRGRISGESG